MTTTPSTQPGDDGVERMDRPNQEVVREPDGDPTDVGEPTEPEQEATPVEVVEPVQVEVVDPVPDDDA